MAELSVEKGFLSKLIETGDVKLVKEQQIKPSFFVGENRRVFSLMMKFYNDTGSLPTERVILRDFPSFRFERRKVDGFEVIGTDEPLKFWCDQLHLKSIHNSSAELIEKVGEQLNRGETEEAFSLLKSGIWGIQNESVISSGVDITKNPEDRKKAYMERKKNRGIQGITFGIDELDKLMKGLGKDTFTMMIATPGIGKTWFLVMFAAYAMLNNYRVVVFVTEMGNDIMQDRFDAMLYGMMYGDFSYEKFRSGNLDPETEKSYFEFLEEKSRLEPLTIEMATGLSSIASVVEQENPDLVCIDGVYLMEDEQKADADWLRVAHITRGLKRLAKEKHITIFGNSQADKSTSKKTGPELGNISYTQAIGQDCDNILALFRDEVMRNDREMGIKILKQREGILGRVYIQWDFTRMCFKGIYHETDSDDAQESPDYGAESRIMGDVL